MYERVISSANLFEAWEHVGGRHVAAGTDAVGPTVFARELDRNLATLRHELASFSYAPLPARQLFIPKGVDREELRELALPALRDKIVQQALRQVLEPLCEARFLDTSYGYRAKKGAAKAIRRLLHELQHTRATHVVRSDIDDFFDTVDHARLLELVAIVAPDDDLVRLIRLIIDNGILEATGTIRDPISGVPTGSVLAPLLSNLYLHELDAFLAAAGITHVRYADDFVILAPSLEQARAAASASSTFLRRDLRLRLNASKGGVFAVDAGFAFLGTRLGPDRRLSIDPAKLTKTATFLEDFVERAQRWPVPLVVERLGAKASGWRNYYGGIGAELDCTPLDQRLRACLAGLIRRRPPHDDGMGGFAAALAVFPWPGTDPATGLGKLRDALASRTSAGDRDRRTQRAGRRQRRRARLLAADKRDFLVWRPNADVMVRKDRLVVRDDKGKLLAERAFAAIRSVVLSHTTVRLRAAVVEACVRHDLPLTITDRRGHPTALLHAAGSQRITLQVRQLEASRGPVGFRIARKLTMAKIRNQANLLEYFGKHRKEASPDEHSQLSLHVDQARAELQSVRRSRSSEPRWRLLLMATEGRAAAAYWAGFRVLLGPDSGFAKRIGRGATDPVNSALNYGYAILYAKIETALVRRGLSTGIGFLHAPGSKPSLTFDLIEPLRAPVVDRTVAALWGRRERVETRPDGYLTEASRRLVAKNVLERWNTETKWMGGWASYGDILDDQIERLVAMLLGHGRFRAFVQRW